VVRYRVLVKSKVQRLTVTDKNLKYEGSLELAADLMAAADLVAGELVQVVNVNNGERFETYLIEAEAGSGKCVLNGGAARLGEVGDQIILLSTVLVPEDEIRGNRLQVVRVDGSNRVAR
jgi:aspartate 1-decarboxylase